jgi:acetylornithine deacetylase/succinyl-diaminopimelate desuccinylase-like protein
LALRGLVDALCSLERGSASEGERAAAALLRDAFAEAGVDAAHVQSFRYSPRWTDAAALHYLAALIGPPWLARLAGVSYALDFSGRLQWSRPLLPRGEGANVVARVHPRGPRERTLILLAHIDAAQTGLMWHPAFTGLWRKVAKRTGKSPSPATTALVGFALRSRALLALSLALTIDVARHRPVPGANDNACAAAGLVELAREFADDPLERTEVVAVATGCEESGMGGAAAWLRRARDEFDPATTLVVGLDQIGAGEPHVLTGEGPPLIAHYRREDVERIGLPTYHAAGWTDPIMARHAGLPAVSIFGIEDGGLPNYHVPTDTPDRVDWSAVDRCLGAARRIARDFDAG